MVDVVKLLNKVPGGAEIVKAAGMDVPAAPPQPPKVIETPTIEAAPAPTEDFDFGEPVPEEKKDPIPAEFVPADPTDEIDSLIDPKDTTGANFKKLRGKLKALNTDHKKLREEAESTKKRLEEFQTGSAVPEVVQSQANRIAELEQYEKLYNFRGTPVYQEKYIKPVEEEKAKLAEVLSGYPNVDIAQIEAAFNAPTDADANRIILNNIKDEIGALEVKSILKSIKKIQADAIQAEKEPAQSLARMQEENDRILAEKKLQAVKVINHTSKSGWSEALGSLRTDKRFKEVSFIEGDSEHNETIVRPMLTKASQAFGQTIATLARHGLTELPQDLAVKLARSDTLAIYSGVLLAERDKLAGFTPSFLSRYCSSKYMMSSKALLYPWQNAALYTAALTDETSLIKGRAKIRIIPMIPDLSSSPLPSLYNLIPSRLFLNRLSSTSATCITASQNLQLMV